MKLVYSLRAIFRVWVFAAALWAVYASSLFGQEAAITVEAQDAALNATAEAGPSQLLFPEGFVVSGRQAQLVRHPEQGRYFLKFAAQAGPEAADGVQAEVDAFDLPMEVLPGKWLTNMILFGSEQPGAAVAFRIWGEITAYQDRNYILPTFAAALSIFGHGPAGEPKEADGTALGTPTGLEAESDLRAIVMSIPRAAPLASITESAANLEAQAAAGGQPFARGGAYEGIWQDGTMLVNREGRIYYDADLQEWLFGFESNASNTAEPPVVVLPCRLLEVMEKTVAGTGRSVKFRITGQVTKYNRRNYLLLRYVRVVYDMGNLGY